MLPLTTYEVTHELLRQTYHQAAEDQNLQSQCDVLMKPLRDVDTVPPQENDLTEQCAAFI